MRLIVITQPSIVQGEAKVVTSLLRHGLDTLHLRKPGAAQSQVSQLLQEIPSELHPKIMLHQHHDLANHFHVKLEDLEHEDPEYWGPGLTYAFLSPLFDSISKEGYPAANFAPQRLAAALEHCQTPIIALGGITAERVGEAARIGFAGVAVLGAIWQAPDPVAALDKLLHACCSHSTTRTEGQREGTVAIKQTDH